ncbi:MAG: GNAT family N-acetyltransferase [Candidatus Hydrogenedentes bacterium]|nr:GNAT family N-acetyltransferase [Candidatus Hydrogenedentota bacterium]
MEIRRATRKDFLAIAALDREAWAGNRHSEFIPDGEHVWRIWVDHAVVWCAAEGDTVAGVVLAFPSTSGAYCLHKAFVHRAYRGQGLGSRLFEALLAEIDRLDTDVFLTVDPVNEAAIALYERWGFRERQFEAGFYRANEDRLVLTRRAGRGEP